ncbi:hypothetical protein K439DRAFT_1647373 [Ramaria rubella]|nr:hypothetical protein K439DRAFT_1647373 [Ramaria rubella]
MDGAIWQSVVGHDGKHFFAPCHDEELRIGVTSSLDWDYSPSHSSGVFSFTVMNLPTELKYQTENLLLATMTPGPCEPTAEELQNHLKFIVDDLLLLYDEGIIVQTPMFPQGFSSQLTTLLGRRVCIVCLAFICDHPAAVKMAGCADTGHLVAPCTRCTVSQAEIFSDKSLKIGFPEHDRSEHLRRAWEWARLDSPKEQEAYFKEHGTRWFEFARLPYFDVIWMTIIDPMHNLLMGVLKNHWYGTWIQGKALRPGTAVKKREPDWVHGYLKDFEMPPHIARPTKQVGEPAGGALSADTYKEFCEPAQQEYRNALASYEERSTTWERANGDAYQATLAAKHARKPSSIF